jgi:hypothetical protein
MNTLAFGWLDSSARPLRSSFLCCIMASDVLSERVKGLPLVYVGQTLSKRSWRVRQALSMHFA